MPRRGASGWLEPLACGVLGFLITFCAGSWFFILQPARSRGGHAASCSRMGTVRDLLLDYRRLNGRFPETISAALPDTALAVDGWGHPWHYESTPDSFILVSRGRDGDSHGWDFWSERERVDLFQGMSREACDDADSDALATELGVHACCGY